MSLRQRVRSVLTHYRFEESTFDAAYKRAVYRDGGLVLWQHRDEARGWRFAIRLEMAPRLSAEGDLTVAMIATGDAGGADDTRGADSACLHRLSFSWVDGAFAGLESPVVPFIARNQGHRTNVADAFAAFEQAFPNNSPSFFCFAALRGIAESLGFREIAAVKSAWQCAYTQAEARHFTNAYDGFWETLGGVAMPGSCWRIPLPLQLKPLTEVSAKHRKRAAMRREHWQAIGEAAQRALRPVTS
jgi:uncharacterized protein VirK/YbjX